MALWAFLLQKGLLRGCKLVVGLQLLEMLIASIEVVAIVRTAIIIVPPAFDSFRAATSSTKRRTLAQMVKRRPAWERTT